MRFPVSRLVAVRVAQSGIGVLLVLSGGAGVAVAAAAMVVAGLLLGVIGAWRRAVPRTHAIITGAVLAGATGAHALAVRYAPIASVETLVQAGALFTLASNPVQRREFSIVFSAVLCVVAGVLLVGFAGGSLAGIAYALFASLCAAYLVMRLASRPGTSSAGDYQALSLTAGGLVLIPLGVNLDSATPGGREVLILLGLSLVFAWTNLELARVVPATGSVVASSSSGIKPIVALLFGAVLIDQPISIWSALLGVFYAVSLAILVRASTYSNGRESEKLIEMAPAQT